MDLTGTDIGAFVAAMFAFTNPFIIPIPFLEITAPYGADIRRPFAVVATITQLITFLLVLWFGADLLELLGASIDGITVAGAVLILSFGIPMAMGKPLMGSSESQEPSSPTAWRTTAVSPMGIPLLVGGGHFALLIATAARFSSTESLITLSIVCAVASGWTLTAMLVAEPLSRGLGETGMAITTRVFGFIILAIGFDVLAGGLTGLFPGLL